MPIAEDPSFERRQWGGRGRGSRDDKPWWCNFWPPACTTPPRPGGGGNTPSSTTKTPIRAPTTTSPRVTVPQHTPPVATRPPAVPPAATQSPKPSNRPQPVPSPTSQPWVPPPMPPPTDTEQTSAQTAPLAPVIVQPGRGSGDSPGNGDDNRPPSEGGGDSGTGTGDGNEDGGANGTGRSGDGDPGSSTGNPPTHSEVAPTPTPLPTGASGTGGIAGGSPGGSTETGSGDTSGGGLQPGAIAGVVVGLLLLLVLLAFLLYKFRRSPAVQRMLAPFRKLGGKSGRSARVDTPGEDGMGRTLISPGPGAAATAGGAAAASAARNRSGHEAHDPQSQPPMRQTGRLHPLSAPSAAVGRDSNRVSTFTYDSVATSGFTPSPISPVSPASMLSPGTVRTSRPIQAPPDPRIIASANAHITRGSVSSTSTGSGISAALSPGQMAWPMPPGTPPAIRHPDGPQYLDFQESGETVVRINQPPRGNRRSGGY